MKLSDEPQLSDLRSYEICQKLGFYKGRIKHHARNLERVQMICSRLSKLVELVPMLFSFR